MAEEYVCTLSEASLEVARRELNEDPTERLSQVETFRTWILSQKHLTCPTDTKFLLKFLRTSKFSQLRARDILQRHLKIRTETPNWYHNLDPADPKTLQFYSTGYIIPLPKRDPKGRLIMLCDAGKFDGDPKKWDKLQVIRACWILSYYGTYKEDDMVNGIVIFQDMSHFTTKIVTFWGMETMKKYTKAWQGNFPGRYKAFHYYNIGSVFEAMMAVVRPILSKKWQDRMVLHGKNMENVYKSIPMECFPDEYLPDDYTGPSAGPTQKIIDNFLDELRSPDFRNRVLYETDEKWKCDLNLAPDNAPSESFRKLNVD